MYLFYDFMAQALPSDPSGGWLTAFSGLGVASLLIGYLAFDNKRLRQELKDERLLTDKKEQEYRTLQADTITRYEKLIPLEVQGQQLHAESIKTLEAAMTMMHQLAGRPAHVDRVMIKELILGILDEQNRGRNE